MTTTRLLFALFATAVMNTAPVGALAADARTAESGKVSLATNARSDSDASQREPDAEAAALALVREHLPALQTVLDRLRSDAPAQYDRAVRDIARSAKRLEVMRHRDERLYELELEVLKSKTTVSLLVARLRVRDHDRDRRSLRAEIERLHDAELARAAYEVEMLETRLQRTQQQLAEARARLDRKTDASRKPLSAIYDDLIRRADRGPQAQRPPKRGTAKANPVHD